jgi:hypothetical protein
VTATNDTTSSNRERWQVSGVGQMRLGVVGRRGWEVRVGLAGSPADGELVRHVVAFGHAVVAVQHVPSWMRSEAQIARMVSFSPT